MCGGFFGKLFGGSSSDQTGISRWLMAPPAPPKMQPTKSPTSDIRAARLRAATAPKISSQTLATGAQGISDPMLNLGKQKLGQ